MASDTAISVEYINGNLISGSTERLRTYMEKSWEATENSYGETVLEFNANVDYYDKSDGATTEHFIALSNHPAIKKITANTDLKEKISGSAILPTYKLPLRIYGDSDVITSNEAWRAFLLGGSSTEYNYEGAYNSDIFYDHYVTCVYPYSKYNAKVLGQYDDAGYSTITITPKYNYFLRTFESNISNRDELELPNVYHYQMIDDVSDDFDRNVEKAIIDYISLDNQLSTLMSFSEDTESSDVSALLQPTQHQILPPEEALHEGIDEDSDGTAEYMVDKNYNLRTYLSSSYVTAVVSGSTIGDYMNMQQTLFFDPSAVSEYLGLFSSIHETKKLFPFYIDFEIPTNVQGLDSESPEYSDQFAFRNIIRNNNFSEYFLSCLNQEFLEQSLRVENFSTLSSATMMESDENIAINSATTELSNVTYRSINFLGLLSRAQNVVVSEIAGSSYIGEHTFARKAGNKLSAPYSFYNCANATNALTDVLLWAETNSDVVDIESLDDLYKMANTNKYYEVLAYRIEKSLITGEVVNNVWIFNNSDDVGVTESINFVDSQIKYDTEYTYNIFAYKLISGIKYNTSTLTIAEQLGEVTTATDGSESCCMMWYDAYGSGEESTDPLYEEAEADESGYVTVSAEDRWMADLYLSYEAELRLVEIPIFSKTLKVQDHPASTLEILPFQKIDNSQNIGFGIKYKAFSQVYMPHPLSDSEQEYIDSYALARDMFLTDKVTSSSRSKAVRFEVYRLEERPKSFNDFRNNLHKSYQLIINNEEGTTSFVNCEDLVNTNKKYYYLFRAINEHEISGPLSEIYEAELVEDGGYKYVIFNILHETDLIESAFKTPTKTFKKILNIKPNLRHLEFNDEDVDFTGHSYEQINNLSVGQYDLEEPIWGKTFKLRLTSKKTGKKIDLNITYNLESG
mgnify:CR=1 FL=1